VKFYSSIAPFYDDIFPLSPAQLAVVQSILRPGDRVLDVGCASGSLALALAKQGYPVLGIDLDSNLITLANERASGTPDCPAVFEKANMLQVGTHYPGTPSGLVVTVGNTLVHLSRAEIKTYLHGVHDHLSPGGRFLIQTINYDRVIKDKIAALPTIDNDKIMFVRKYDLSQLPNSLLFQTSLTIKESGETIENTIPLTPLLAEELGSMLAETGFSISTRYGNFKQEPYDENSYALIVVADKNLKP